MIKMKIAKIGKGTAVKKMRLEKKEEVSRGNYKWPARKYIKLR